MEEKGNVSKCFQNKERLIDLIFPNISIENAKLMRSLFYFRLIN